MLHTNMQAELRQIFGVPITIIHADDQVLLMAKSVELRDAIADLLATLAQERDELDIDLGY